MNSGVSTRLRGGLRDEDINDDDDDDDDDDARLPISWTMDTSGLDNHARADTAPDPSRSSLGYIMNRPEHLTPQQPPDLAHIETEGRSAHGETDTTASTRRAAPRLAAKDKGAAACATPSKPRKAPYRQQQPVDAALLDSADSDATLSDPAIPASSSRSRLRHGQFSESKPHSGELARVHTRSKRRIRVRGAASAASPAPAPAAAASSSQPTSAPRLRAPATVTSSSTAVEAPAPTATSPVPPPLPAATVAVQERRRTRECRIDGCANYIINKGLCFRHGGGKRCAVDGCNSSAKNAGKCWKHGGSLKCLIDGCEKKGKSRGLCWAHGGGKKCTVAVCSKVAVSNGLCWAHGGGKRCGYEGCERAAYERTHNYCERHYELLKDGMVTLEV